MIQFGNDETQSDELGHRLAEAGISHRAALYRSRIDIICSVCLATLSGPVKADVVTNDEGFSPLVNSRSTSEIAACSSPLTACRYFQMHCLLAIAQSSGRLPVRFGPKP